MLRCAVLILVAGLASAQLADKSDKLMAAESIVHYYRGRDERGCRPKTYRRPSKARPDRSEAGNPIFPAEVSIPQWRSPNMVEGVIHLPRSAVQEPFQAWFDGNNSRSRIDYHGGTVKTYQMMKENSQDELIYYKYVPAGYKNWTCYYESTGKLPQPALPYTAAFNLTGSVNYFGAKAWKWEQRLVYRNWRFVHTLWVKYDQQGTTAHAIPLKYETQMIDTAMGIQVDHFHIDYTNYVVGDIDPDVFILNDACNEAADDGNMNPMEEFVGPSHRMKKEFDHFKSKHYRRYETDLEHDKRFSIFRHNLRYIQSHNRAGHSYTLAVNHLADRTPEELAAMRGIRQPNLSDHQGTPFPYSDAEVEELSKDMPEEVDWRLLGAVTPVTNQGYCSSSWAFASVGAVEGALFLNSKQLVKLSEQALLDCSWEKGSINSGCSTGFHYHALHWILEHRLPTYEEYGGYLEQNGICHLDNMTKSYTIDDAIKIPHGDGNKLKLAIFRHGPVAVGLDASSTSFSFYSHGIFDAKDCVQNLVNHAMLAVGFGVQDGKKYWLVKNSWGQLWGSEGYMLISAERNVCGVQSTPMYAVISK